MKINTTKDTTTISPNLTVDELCNILGISGLVTYDESERFIRVKNCLYDKTSGHITNLSPKETEIK